MTSILPELIVIWAVSFNAILAVVNGHAFALERTHVVLAEVATYGAATTLIFFNADRRMMPWLLLALAIIALALLLGLGNGNFNAKYPRDVLVIPVFVMLGMTCHRGSLVRLLIVVQTVVFLVAILEAASPALYSELFRVLDYYINTRDFSQNQFWNTESTLFVSATRPGARFFSFINLHRLSSLFLEPVSLGNYCVVAAAMILTFWRDLAMWLRSYLVASTIMLLIGCDGRLAAISILIILAAAIVTKRISSRWSVFYLPLTLVASALFVVAATPEVGADNFGGRLAGSLMVLSQIDVLGFLGLDASSSAYAADSGISYFVLTQSVVGVVMIWVCICLLPDGNDYRSRAFVHSIALFIPLNLMISYSFFSIKVAAMMWFCYGFIYGNKGSEATTDNGDLIYHPARSNAVVRLAE
jgi:putative polymerase